ncbi:MAG: mechanosensitive ion channel family protein [Kaiparowitsia implicata GSE-PSE-MK54-09C]|jgi:MscS family membrane protein|nr:mechanosensitive ion channel family protein [Kaiparowitsia implicata GSE-PSE-MK54-09C]
MANLYTQLFRLSGEHPSLFWVGVLGLIALISWLSGNIISRLVNWLLRRLTTDNADEFYGLVIQPQQLLLQGVLILTLLDLVAYFILQRDLRVRWYPYLEIPLTLAFSLTLGWFLTRSFRAYFNTYLLDAALRNGRKTNSEILILAKFLANAGIVLILVVAFAETHSLNIFGLVASLGVGGIAVAFAAQKVLEQLLGGLVIYVDHPFGIDDYIGLPDGTFGRVESIGLRSTKIRTSGKGTLAIVPNNVIIQSTVENFSGAKKVMAITYLNLYRAVTPEEQALIRQVILESTQDLSGIDPRSTDITFREMDGGRLAQAQITLFILGSGDTSMTIRRQLLDVASQKLTNRLKQYGISFDIEEPTVYVDAPITV